MKIRFNSKNIAKFAAMAAGATIALTSLTGCGNVSETNYTYTHAVIFEEGKTTIVPIQQWRQNGEQIQLLTDEGNTFLTSTFNTKLFKEVEGGLSVEDFAISLSDSDCEIGYLQEQDTSKVMNKK